jgi:hypothetical protein
MLFLWVLTWFSYGLFMKNQISILNITGAVVSASLMVFLYFWPALNAFFFAKNRSISKTQKAQIQPHKDEKTPQQITEIKTQKQETESIKQPEPIKQTTEIKTQKQETESIKLADKTQQLPSKSNGCPKNLDYYTKKPRPKQTPEECITCKNLINCVCLTSN